MSGLDVPWLVDELAHLAGLEHQRATTAAWLLYGHGYHHGHARLADALNSAVHIDAGRATADTEHPFVDALVTRITTRLLVREHTAACVRLADLTQRRDQAARRPPQPLPHLWDGWPQDQAG